MERDEMEVELVQISRNARNHQTPNKKNKKKKQITQPQRKAHVTHVAVANFKYIFYWWDVWVLFWLNNRRIENIFLFSCFFFFVSFYPFFWMKTWRFSRNQVNSLTSVKNGNFTKWNLNFQCWWKSWVLNCLEMALIEKSS